MFKIVEKTEDNLKTLNLTENLFHEAYENGENSYHVKSEKKDFDIVYVDNDSIVPDAYKGMYSQVGIDEILPKYKKYDEKNTELISFALFDNKKKVAFYEVNEYSIVMAKLLIAKNYDVYFTDELINLFIDVYNEENFDNEVKNHTGCIDNTVGSDFIIKKNSKIHIVKSFNDLDKESTCFIKDIDDMFMTDKNDMVNYISAFHNMFFLQDFIDKNIKDIKYIKIKISSINGIGIIPIYLKKLNNAFSIYNIKIVLDPKDTRYSIEFLNKVFSYDFSPSDMCDENTIYLDDISRIMLTYFYIKSDDKYGYEIFSKEFINECEIFINSTINCRRALALLIRGTDYISTNDLGENRMAPIDSLLPMIDKWINDDKYEVIFLATEDEDVLDKLKNIYGDKLYFVKQKRFRASEFKKGQTIAEREKEKYTKDEYQKNIDDTTIKYLKALYTLSKCDSFICSGMCNGYQVVKSLNNGRFMKEYLYHSENVL